jgi:alpha/beta superfamily hydrolase
MVTRSQSPPLPGSWLMPGPHAQPSCVKLSQENPAINLVRLTQVSFGAEIVARLAGKATANCVSNSRACKIGSDAETIHFEAPLAWSSGTVIGSDTLIMSIDVWEKRAVNISQRLLKSSCLKVWACHLFQPEG